MVLPSEAASTRSSRPAPVCPMCCRRSPLLGRRRLLLGHSSLAALAVQRRPLDLARENLVGRLLTCFAGGGGGGVAKRPDTGQSAGAQCHTWRAAALAAEAVCVVTKRTAVEVCRHCKRQGCRHDHRRHNRHRNRGVHIPGCTTWTQCNGRAGGGRGQHSCDIGVLPCRQSPRFCVLCCRPVSTADRLVVRAKNTAACRRACCPPPRCTAHLLPAAPEALHARPHAMRDVLVLKEPQLTASRA